MNSTWTYAQKYIDIPYFLEYPLGNTWTHATPFYLLCKYTKRMLGFVGRSLFYRELVAALPYKYPLPYLLLHTILEFWHAPRLPELCELCDLERVVSLKKFWEKEAIPLLDFEIIPAHFTFLVLFQYLIYIVMNFQRVSLSFSLEW